MKFAEIIRATGLKPEEYPSASELTIVLYDDKQREVSGKTVQYAHPLFQNNPSQFEKFSNFLTNVEQGLVSGRIFPARLSVRVMKETVTVTHFSAFNEIFFR